MISFSENKNEDSTTSAYGVNRGFANEDTLINSNNNNITLRKMEKAERELSRCGCHLVSSVL